MNTSAVKVFDLLWPLIWVISKTFFSHLNFFFFFFFSSGRRSNILSIHSEILFSIHALQRNLFLIGNICAAPRTLIFLFGRVIKFLYGDRIISKTIKYSLRTHIYCALVRKLHEENACYKSPIDR